ncbi:oxidoreductase [Mucilaginibacter sp. HC2]|uniref:WD40/YVTN/BNR-like repeat-containing protein n=1 Tax=Mucilaginibacter inviolabilis TaxID=2714892 RepID=UPI00140DDFBF|nr:YCF48-related protein [Mucilaginibacter inviolabilis]NHA04115.1 oxidoreductase [Mucilaginibacter inviolabilis]
MKTRYHLIVSILFSLLLLSTISRSQSIMILQQDKPTSIRGLSVVNDQTAWISGSKGYIALTNDGGKTWNWQQIKGYEKSEFRDIEAFSDKEAVVMSSGTPSLVLKTIDGGKSWQEKYRKTDTTYFFDAMDFANERHGYILGDPIKDKFLLMETKDGGETWANVSNPPVALPGEAAFAASGTCFRIYNESLFIVSGGKNSRIISTTNNGAEYNYVNLPIIHSKSSQGAFSLAAGKNKIVVVGGDYEKDKRADSVATIFSTHPPIFNNPIQGPLGFQSCVECIKGDIFLSTGTSGSNITMDGGHTWKQIDSTSFNVCGKAKHGKMILLAGNGGKIAILKM